MALWQIALGAVLVTVAVQLAADTKPEHPKPAPVQKENKEVDLLLWPDPFLPYTDPATAPIIVTPDNRVWMTPQQRDAINDLLGKATILIEKQQKEIDRLKGGTGCS